MAGENDSGAPRESPGDDEQPSHGQLGRRNQDEQQQQQRPPPTPQDERDTGRKGTSGSQTPQQGESQGSSTPTRPAARPAPTTTTSRMSAHPSMTGTTRRTRSRVPDSYSLAGPAEANYDVDGRDARGRPFVYVHPDYGKIEAKYGRNTRDLPVWGLAKPLPRVVRPGMKRLKDDEERQKKGRVGGVEGYATAAGGEEQPATQMGMTPGTETEQGQQVSRQSSETSEQAVFPPSEDSEQTVHPIETEAQSKGEAAEPEDEEFFNTWSKYRHYFREPFAEWLATTVAIIIGLCGTLAVSTAKNEAGTRISNNISWGLGYMVGIYIAGGVSGGHLNPAISIALSIFRGFPTRKCTYYIIAQGLGAITAGGIAYCLYRDSILNMGPNVNMGSELGFFTEPQTYVNGATAFFDEFVATAILLCAIFAMGDDNNAPPGAGMHSFIIGLLIFVLSICLGFNTGGSFNPARDFGPRLVALMAGFGGHIFRDRGGWWFWGGWVASITGGIAGALMYDIFIFVGGESPVNYPRRRRRRAKLQKEAKWRRWLGIGKHKVPDLEGEIKQTET